MELNKIYNEDCLTGLSLMPDKSINCCVTSPPYYGLRDYGVDGQIGLEQTPEQYVQKLVEVFREVKRVLRDDGTLFLNIADSYWGSGKGPTGFNGIGNQSKRQGFSDANALNVKLYGTFDKEPEGYLMNGCFSENLCDACQSDYQNHKFHIDNSLNPKQSVSPSVTNLENKKLQTDHLPTSDSIHQQNHSEASIQDSMNLQDHEGEPPLSSQESMLSVSSRPLQDECLPMDNVFSDQPYNSTSLDGVQQSEHKSDVSKETSCCTQDNASPFVVRDDHSQCTSGYCSRCGTYSNSLKTYIQPQSYKEFINIPRILKGKDLVGIPFRLAFALQADGWYLRQDIIWHKPNPMPESVRDRCTKAHEYIFLLSKSKKYYYDGDAIKQPLADSSKTRLSQDIENQEGSSRVPGKANGNMKAVIKGYGHRGTGDKKLTGHSGNYDADGKLIGDGMANKRSVWTVTTKSFKEAHFATFPEDLIVDMIKAGCPEDGVVLDPFMGAGTAGVVARKLKRNYIGFELNADYINIAETRINNCLNQPTKKKSQTSTKNLSRGTLDLFNGADI